MVGALGNGHDPFVHMQMSGTQNKSFSSSSVEISDSSHRPGGKRVTYYSCTVPFKKKTCKYYSESQEKKGFCCCGREKSHHSQEARQGSGGTWSLKDHVESKETNARGEIEFHGTSRKTRAKYIRVSDDTNAKDALNLLLKEWRLEYPKLLVSVTGGAKAFRLPVKLKQLFSNGLYKVAQTTGAWVITGGTNTGVMKHVGEALQVVSKGQIGSNMESQKRVYCIGIATWGIVEHRHLLVNSKSTVKYFMTNSSKSAGACLDNNHTHFFLVDNGTVNRYGAEIDFRARLENQIIKMEVDKNRGGVPSILLVLEGGPNTVKTVHAALTQDPPVPVVVIKDSGRAADLLAFAHNISHGEGPFYEIGDAEEHKFLLKKIEQIFPELDSSGCHIVYDQILLCIEKKHMITIFRMEEGAADLDQAILTALLHSNISLEDQLKLALIWNRPDLARTHIFIEGCKWELLSLEDSMKTALTMGRPEFVEILLDQGMNMAEFLTLDNLKAIYSARASEKDSPIKFLVDADKRHCGSIRLSDVNRIFCQLTGLDLDLREENHTVGDMVPLGIRSKYRECQNPFKELFIWAVLNNMQKMALCFWKRGEEAMAKALVACKLYFAMAEKKEVKDHIIFTLRQNGEEFQRRAVQLLDVYFRKNEQYAIKLLKYELENWGKTTNLSLAVRSDHTQFVAHPCSQKLLTDIWNGQMTFQTKQSLKVILCMFLPPLLLCLGFQSKEAEVQEARKPEIKGKDPNDKARLESITQDNDAFDASSRVSIVPASEKDVETNTSSENATTPPLKWWEKFSAFYTAPITKFWGNVFSYLVFLVLFTYVLTGKLYSKLSIAEIILITFVISLTTEEIRQILKSDSGSFRKKLYEWSRSKWNLCDGLAILLYYIGLILRLNQSTLTAGRVVFAIDIMFWIIRLLDIFSVNQNLGPYVVIIGKMTIDLAYFLFIMAVFLLAYGVARRALLEPNISFAWTSVAEIFFVPYFQVYGELFIEKEHLFSSNTTYFGTTKHSDVSEPVVSLLMAFYLLIANILLLNLLIAIFNNTFAKVQTKSSVIWKSQRYRLILEYAQRPLLVPPFVVINHLWSLSRYIYDKCRRYRCSKERQKDSKEKSDNNFKFAPSASEKEELLEYEEGCLIELLHDLHSTRDGRVELMLERMAHVPGEIEEAKKDAEVRQEGIDRKLVHLQQRQEGIDSKLIDIQHEFQELKRGFSEVSALSLKLNKLLSIQASPNPNRYQMFDELRRASDLDGTIYSGRRIPKRSLSHNSYLHKSLSENTEQVKEAPWNFRRSCLPSSSTSTGALAEASLNQQALDGEDTVDDPPQPFIETEHTSNQNNEMYVRAGGGDEGVFVENDNCVLSEIDETDFDEVDTNAVTLDVDDIYNIDYFEYNPQEYTAPMLRLSSWIDSGDPSGLAFNSKDDGVNRVSNFRQYDVINGRPRNPFGRTGLTGRGLLGRWGPNHATEAIITRWKRKSNNDKFERGKFSLEVLALKKKEEFGFPGGLIISMELVPKVVSQIFNLGDDADNQLSLESSEVGKMLTNGFEVSADFDDSRNTDNAWLETKIFNFHDEDGNITKSLNLANTELSWIEVDSDLQIARKRKDFLAKVAEIRGAHF